MSSIKLQGSTSGEITIAAPAVAGTNTLTLPASTGTIVTSESGVGDLPSTIAGPAFSAYLSSNQTISHNTSTKIQFDTEEFDTASCYDNTTNYRFTPNVAGYYQVNGETEYTGFTGGRVNLRLYKNGSSFKFGTTISNNDGSAGTMGPTISALVYMNGTTDYIELYATQTSGTTQNVVALSGQKSYFQAVLVRAA